jgi:cell division FtsZ-interacting protein ZapD
MSQVIDRLNEISAGYVLAQELLAQLEIAHVQTMLSTVNQLEKSREEYGQGSPVEQFARELIQSVIDDLETSHKRRLAKAEEQALEVIRGVMPSGSSSADAEE